MLIKLTDAVNGKKVFLVNEELIENVVVDTDGQTVVFLSKDINPGIDLISRSVFAVQEAPEDIFQQQFKTCESTL